MSAPPFGKEGIGLAQTKKCAELSVRNRIISKQKYCLLLVDKYSSRWKEIHTHCTFFCQADWRSFDFVFCWLYFLFTIGGGNFSGKWCWQWLDDSDDRGNDWLCSFRWLLIVAMIKRWLFQFNRRLQADPNLPHLAKLADDLILWLRRWWCFNIPYVSKNLKRESAIMEKLNHPTIVSLHEVVFVIYFYWCLVLDFVLWRQSRRLIWKREDRALRAAGGEEQVVLQLWSSFLWQW